MLQMKTFTTLLPKCVSSKRLHNKRLEDIDETNQLQISAKNKKNVKKAQKK